MIFLKQDSNLYQKILLIEELMEEASISISGKDLRLVVGNKQYKVGRCSDTFPPPVDEPFVREE